MPVDSSRAEIITSPQNPFLKDVRRAVLRGELTEAGYAAAESFHMLEEALRSDAAQARRFGAEAQLAVRTVEPLPEPTPAPSPRSIGSSAHASPATGTRSA